MPWRHMREWRYSSTILHLGTSWRWVVSFTPSPLYRWGRSPRYPLDMRLGEPQRGSWRCGQEKNLTPNGNRTPAVQEGSLLLYRLNSSGSKYACIYQNCIRWALFIYSIRPLRLRCTLVKPYCIFEILETKGGDEEKNKCPYRETNTCRSNRS
jgi:hypothetical protein